jgi:hypothetical protein
LWWISGGSSLLRKSWSSRQRFPAALNILSAAKLASVPRTYSATPGTSFKVLERAETLSSCAPHTRRPGREKKRGWARGWRRALLRDSSASASVPTASPQILRLTPRRSPNVQAGNQLPSLKLSAPKQQQQRTRQTLRGRGRLHHAAESVAPTAIATRAVVAPTRCSPDSSESSRPW